MFTDLPLARVGLSESEAQRQGISVRVAKLPMSSILRTEATDETSGFMKVVVSANNDRILGFTMIGSESKIKHDVLLLMPIPPCTAAPLGRASCVAPARGHTPCNVAPFGRRPTRAMPIPSPRTWWIGRSP
jgi:pyruvate/2-oxoglutarate dehydrogenase complex dihydrolipoamide dehydrogenase (E3) component